MLEPVWDSDGQQVTNHAGSIGLSELAGEGRFNCRAANDHVMTPKTFIQAAPDRGESACPFVSSAAHSLMIIIIDSDGNGLWSR